MFATTAAPRYAPVSLFEGRAQAQPNASVNANANANAYTQIGVQTGIASASPHQLVLMLFDGFSDSLALARGAMRNRQLEVKGRALSRAIRIVSEGLRTGLNLREGGVLAADLNELYGYICMRLTQANAANDEAALDECQRLMQPLRDAWAAIAPGQP